MLITRPAKPAMSGSCVTSTMVMPRRPQLLEQRHHLDAGLGVEVAGRLVGQDHLRLGDQRARDGDALLLAARHLVRVVVDALAEPDALQRLARALRGARAPGRRAYSSGSSTFSSAVVRDSRLKLWNTKPSVRLRMRASPSESSCEIAWPSRRNSPARRLVEAAEDVHQRRLARARRAHDRDELALVDGQRDAAQRVHLDVAQLVDLGDPVELDDRCRTLSAERRRGCASSEHPPERAAARRAAALPSPPGISASVTTRSPSCSSAVVDLGVGAVADAGAHAHGRRRRPAQHPERPPVGRLAAARARRRAPAAAPAAAAAPLRRRRPAAAPRPPPRRRPPPQAARASSGGGWKRSAAFATRSALLAVVVDERHVGGHPRPQLEVRVARRR